MWDSAFNVMYGKYFIEAADFQVTLDNFYARQHKDGFICRELSEEEAGDRFSRDDPGSTGPNILPWAEWEYYCTTNNKERLKICEKRENQEDEPMVFVKSDVPVTVEVIWNGNTKLIES